MKKGNGSPTNFNQETNVEYVLRTCVFNPSLSGQAVIQALSLASIMDKTQKQVISLEDLIEHFPWIRACEAKGTLIGKAAYMTVCFKAAREVGLVERVAGVRGHYKLSKNAKGYNEQPDTDVSNVVNSLEARIAELEAKLKGQSNSQVNTKVKAKVSTTYNIEAVCPKTESLFKEEYEVLKRKVKDKEHGAMVNMTTLENIRVAIGLMPKKKRPTISLLSRVMNKNGLKGARVVSIKGTLANSLASLYVEELQVAYGA